MARSADQRTAAKTRTERAAALSYAARIRAVRAAILRAVAKVAACANAARSKSMSSYM